MVKSTNIYCWRVHGLPIEYWRPQILYSVARGIGVPLALNEATSKNHFGFYARTLVDINLLELFPNFFLVESEGYDFNIIVKYEKLSSLCYFCHIIGHSLEYDRAKNVAMLINKKTIKRTLYILIKSNIKLKILLQS